jgi:hypothetical protein
MIGCDAIDCVARDESEEFWQERWVEERKVRSALVG